MVRTIKFAALLCGFVILLTSAASIRAQADAEDSLVPGRRKDDPPKGIQESLSKLRIEKEKKDFNEMLQRGDDALKLAEQLKAGADDQQEQISSIGKLVKKVRDELGAEGSIDAKDGSPQTRADAVKALKLAAASLSEELKKCTRFTVSASAINRANEVLRLVKFLHG